MNAQTRNANLLLAAVLLAGGAAYGISGMEPDDSRTLAYTGYLENGSAPQSGTFQLRFGLFASENADDSCLLTGPTDCTLWSEEQSDVQLDSGVFSVVLGEATALSDTVLAQTSLYLGIAVQGPADAAFTVVGKQKLQMVPFAARAAAAKDYKVTGDLTVGGQVVASSVELDMGVGGMAFENSGTGLDIRALTNPSAGDPLFRILSAGNAERLRVDHDGTLFTEDNIEANGSITSDSLNVGNPAIDGDAVLNVAGNVNMLGTTTTYTAQPLSNDASTTFRTAPSDGIITYWSEGTSAGSHNRTKGVANDVEMVRCALRVEAGESVCPASFPVRKGDVWYIQHNGGQSVTVTARFTPFGQ